MQTETQESKLRFERIFKAPPEEVYRAFTNSSALDKWLCNTASVQPRVGGRFYANWDTGYYAAGEFLLLEPDRKISFSWQGRDEPGATIVRVTLFSEQENTRMMLEHGDFGQSEDWQRVRTQVLRGWESGLENLKSMLETGQDLRIVNRPLLGIFFSAFDSSEAKRLGIPISEGMKIDSTAEGLGAQQAGLQNGDVIVEVNGQPATSYTQLVGIISSFKAGDHVDVGYYRGAEKREADMTLSPRPIPEIPPSPVDLAAALERIYRNDLAQLERALVSVSEQEASARPSPLDWTIKENIAHLIQSQRANQVFINDLVSGYTPIYDGSADNLPAYVRATAQVYGTLSALQDQLRHAMAETVAFVANLTPEFTAHKGSYWWLGHNLLVDLNHSRGHVEQITALLKTIRGVVETG